MDGLRLSSEEIERLAAAQAALLSPLQDEDAVEWQLRANAAVRRLLHADHSLFGVPGESGPAIATNDTDPAFPGRLLDYYIGVDEGDYRFRDPWMEKMGRARRAGGAGAYHQDMLCEPGEVRSSAGYQEIFAPSGVMNLAGLSVPMPVGEATEFFGFEGAAAEERSRRAYQLLRLVFPAFQAGVRIQQEIRGRSAALTGTLDEIGRPIAIYSARGTLLHPSRALIELLAADPESTRLASAVDELARSLLARLDARGRSDERVLASDPSTHVRTGRSEYRLVGGHLPPTLLAGAGVLVHVEPVSSVLPTPTEVRGRFGLTRRESEVAVLLAQGLSDARVARQLTLSVHTARRYSESVLKKLGIHSRAAVALTLLRRSDPPPPG